MLLCTIQVFRFVWYPPVTAHEYSIYAKQMQKKHEIYEVSQWAMETTAKYSAISQRCWYNCATVSAEIWNMLPGTLLMHNSYGIQLTWPTSRVCVGFCTVFLCCSLSQTNYYSISEHFSTKSYRPVCDKQIKCMRTEWMYTFSTFADKIRCTQKSVLVSVLPGGVVRMLSHRELRVSVSLRSFSHANMKLVELCSAHVSHVFTFNVASTRSSSNYTHTCHRTTRIHNAKSTDLNT